MTACCSVSLHRGTWNLSVAPSLHPANGIGPDTAKIFLNANTELRSVISPAAALVSAASDIPAAAGPAGYLPPDKSSKAFQLPRGMDLVSTSFA